jgi:hypothetical protein
LYFVSTETHQTDVLEHEKVKDKLFSLYSKIVMKQQKSPVKKILGRAKVNQTLLGLH